MRVRRNTWFSFAVLILVSCHVNADLTWHYATGVGSNDWGGGTPAPQLPTGSYNPRSAACTAFEAEVSIVWPVLCSSDAYTGSRCRYLGYDPAVLANGNCDSNYYVRYINTTGVSCPDGQILGPDNATCTDDQPQCPDGQLYDNDIGFCVTPPQCDGTVGGSFQGGIVSAGATGNTCTGGCEYSPSDFTFTSSNTGYWTYTGTGQTCAGDSGPPPSDPPVEEPPIEPTDPEPEIPDDGNNTPEPATDEGQETISGQLGGIQNQLQNLEGGTGSLITQGNTQSQLLNQINDNLTGAGSPAGSGYGNTGDKDGDGENDGEDTGDGVGGPGDLYKPTDLTYSSILQGFVDRMSAAPFVQAADGFFDMNIGGTCPVWTLPATDFTPAIPVDMQCSSAMDAIWPIIYAIILATAGFVAFRWAFL